MNNVYIISSASVLEGRLDCNGILVRENYEDAIYNRQIIDQCYDIVRYDCIETLNEELGGNVIDMTGTDKQVCRRFYNAYHKLALAV